MCVCVCVCVCVCLHIPLYIGTIQTYFTVRTETEEELKNLLMRVKEENEKASLKLNIKKKKEEDHVFWAHYFITNRRKKGGSSDKFLFLRL